MSLVGPRPERVAYVRDFERSIVRYTDRHRVKSGLTGWAQVNGLRGQTSIADRVEWDNYYIQNWSLRLDLKIIALTLVEVLRLRDSPSAKAQAK
jgi:lipopolysaccharide/colanic/teichoic acid biosynthesis glycosyltransferase